MLDHHPRLSDALAGCYGRLTPDQMSILRGRRYNRLKKGQGGDHRSKSQSATLIDSSQWLAKEHGVHRATIIRDGKRAGKGSHSSGSPRPRIEIRGNSRAETGAGYRAGPGGGRLDNARENFGPRPALVFQGSFPPPSPLVLRGKRSIAPARH